MTRHLQKQFLVSNKHAGQRVDAVLAQLIPEYSRSQMSSWIKNAFVLLSKRPCKPKDKVREGEPIEVDVPCTPQSIELNPCTAQDIPVHVVYEDEELLVLNKPAGLVVHPGAGNKDHTLVNALLHYAPNLEQLPRAGIIHRLDKDTTGLLVVAKTPMAHTSLIRQMQARSIERHYITLVQGHLISGGTVDTGFGRHPRNRLKMAVTGQGRQAITHYRIKKQYKDFTLLDIRLMTGRTHQIRVHCKYIKHPVVGDPLYGGRIRTPPGASEMLTHIMQQFKRQALHACFLSVQHPRTKETIPCTVPLPKDFQILLNALAEHYDL